jgi:hypothetical protein
MSPNAYPKPPDLTRVNIRFAQILQCLAVYGRALVSVVADLSAEVGIDPAIEQQIDQHLGRIAEALTRRDEILAVLR